MTQTKSGPTKPKRNRVDMSRLDQAVGYRLRLAQLKIFQEFRVAFEEMDIRPTDYAVLTLIADNPGRKQSEIAAALSIKRANFVVLVNRIEQRGLVERRANSDKRSNALHLTPSGKVFVEVMENTQQAYERTLASKLGTVAERDAFVAAVNRIIAW